MARRECADAQRDSFYVGRNPGSVRGIAVRMPRLPSVILFPDPKLRRRAETVPDAVFGTSGLREYCQLLANLLVAVEQADVLAGTQIDFEPSWCVLALQTSDKAVSVLLNPVIRDESGESVAFE